MLLKKQGLGTAAWTLSKSVCFFDHLVSRIHSIHQTQYLVGRELTTLEIRNTHHSYLGSLCKEHGDFPNLPANEHKKHGDNLFKVVENFPNQPKGEREQSVSQASPSNLSIDSKKLKAMARMAEIGTDGQLPPKTLYFMDIGLDMEQIKEMARKYPSITCRDLERKLKPLVVFLLDLGVPPSNIPDILYKQPQLCGFSLSDNIIPSMAYFETLGLDKSKWAKVIHRCPHLLTHSRQKVEATVDYLYELGLPRNRIGKFLTRCPQIMSYSIDENLRPTAEYFRSVGVNLKSLLSHYPHVFGRSIEGKLKPVTEFFLDKGYSIDEVGTMGSVYGSIYSLSLAKNMIPKWNFFLTMDYPRSDLVKYTNYFGYSLERRIKPRYAKMKQCGVKLSLGTFLSTSYSDFPEILNRMKKKKMLEAQHASMALTSDKDGESDNQ